MKTAVTRLYKGLLLSCSFTIASIYAIAQSNPGGVGGASVWLRADAGITATGTNVTGWVNQANAANSFAGTNNPQLNAGNINFNPAITFSGSNFLTSSLNVLPANSAYTKFVVFRFDGVPANNLISSGGIGDNALFAANTNTNLCVFHNGAILTASNVVDGTRYYLGTAGFSSGVAAGTFINVNGVNKAAINSAAPYVASTMQLGAHGGGNNLAGRIAEVIVYPSALASGAVSTRQIQSYLGLKYGITIGHDYLASDGTSNIYSISTHNNNIAGLGRDDNSAFNQKQSQSINTAITNQVVMAAGSLANTNAMNASVIAADKQFLVWGDDNGSITSTVPVAGFSNVNNKLARTWKLQNTGNFSQQVTVYFPTISLNQLSNAGKYLVQSTSATFATPGAETPGTTTTTINGISYTGFIVTFPSAGTLYFSFGSKAVNPGNIGGASVWVRADAGINSSGATISSWVNQVNPANNFTASGTPQLTDGAVNFNPTVLFGGSDFLTSAGNVPALANSNYTRFIVFRSVAGNNLLSAAHGTPGLAIWAPNQALTIRHGVSDFIKTPDGFLNSGRQYLASMIFSNGTVNGTQIRINGSTNVSATSSASYGVDQLQIGAYNSTTILSAGSNIAEAVVYNSALSTADARQVETYLSLKYGLTMGGDYLASNSNNIYSVSGYSSDIAGIGRDDNTALDQRQGKSGNAGSQVVMASGTVNANNALNTASIIADQQFLVWGDNDLPGYTSSILISQKRLASTWKLENTNSFNQAVTVYYPVSALAGLGNSPKFIYGTPGSLDDGTATQVNAGANVIIGGETYRSYSVTFPTTAVLYFSFAGQVVPEICGNGIDDNLDGYTDELDASCTPIPSCTAPAPPLTNFGIKQDWVTSSADALATSVSPTVADLDGDGIPEILTVRAGGAGLTYFKGDGSNLSKNTIDYNIQLPVRVTQSTMQPAVADVDRDGLPEVIVLGNDGFVYVFNNVSGSSGIYKYRSLEPVSTRFASGSPRLADINEDGVPEIIVGLDVFQFNFGQNRLLKAVTGSATAPYGKDGFDWGNDVVVIDIMSSNPGKEIVAGSQVYGVNLATGITTVLANLSTIAGAGVIPANNDGPSAVADLDNDGQLDIVYPNGTDLIVWDPASAILKMKIAYNNNGVLYMGMPTIANVYDEKTLDAKAVNYPEIIFNARYVMHAFNLNKTTGPVWSLVTTDGSAETSVTAFDLNGDGVQEIIYNDETNIRVINGNKASPSDVATYASGTATWMEHPVVADVDNDGSAEFVCVSNGTNAFTGMLRVFGAAVGSSGWQGTRKVWNGRGYRAKSVNDDLTIPVIEQNITVQYPSGSGKYPLDIFNSQVDARVLAPGIVASPDLSISALSIANSSTACSFVPASAVLSYTLTNNGSAIAPAGTPVRFYKGDPTVSGAVLLSTTDALAANLYAGASVTRTVNLNLAAYASPYTIFAVVNDNGLSVVPITFPVAGISLNECNYLNNISSVLISPVSSDFGNMSSSWPIASATTSTNNAAWLGNNVPTNECANSLTDEADGLVLTSGANGGNGSSATPWVMSGVGSVFNFTLTVNGNGASKPVYWALWYDADGNGNFTDATDVFMNGNMIHGSPVSTNFNFSVPPASGAANGVIRVIAIAVDPGFTKTMNGSGSFTNGEVEDYFVSYATLLPITLTKFTAFETGNCAARIEWTSSSDETNTGYEILHSNDGATFKTIAKMNSNHNAGSNSYAYTDNSVANGLNYYRLKMLDIDGTYAYSRTVTVRTECGKTIIQLMPNPVNTVATITGLKMGDEIRVTSSDGRAEIKKLATTGTESLNMSVLANGVHLVQILRNGIVVSNMKVTKL
ncbi:beta strand repeat-containing protein [Flavitalea sp.]|nr:VCBS repeat-containing protein [Flavitalea sp.]